jgi:hypothetical protein
VVKKPPTDDCYKVHRSVLGWDFTLEDAVGSHACSLESRMRVVNGIALGRPLLCLFDNVNSVTPLKGKFYSGDSYIVLLTKKKANALERDIHFWLGAESSQDEQGVAAYKTVELDESLGAPPPASPLRVSLQVHMFAHTA